jgi:hypothetical protein
MYGFANKHKVEALSEYAARLLKNPPVYNEQQPIINPPALANDLRYRRYNAVVEVVEKITAAYWDSSEGMYRAGSGLVRIMQRYNPLGAQDVTVDPATRIGPWNYDSNQGRTLGVVTEFREVLCYNADPCTEHYTTRPDGTPNLVYVFEDINGDLWVHERQEFSDNVVPASSSSCILPGQGGTIELYTYADGSWSPSGITCTLYDPSCYIMALPGETFWVHVNREHCKDEPTCSANAISPHGNIRRVRMSDSVSCGDIGQATILMGSGCTGSPSPCNIQVCNTSNRPIKCSSSIDYEDGTAFLIQGTCMWHVIPDPRATIARITLEAEMCGDAPAVEAGSEQFIDVCEWHETISEADNPFNRRSCAGSQIELTWDATKCKWYVSDVPRIGADIVTTIECGDAGCDPIKKKYYTKASIESCDCTEKSGVAIPMMEVTVNSGIRYTYNGGVCTMHQDTVTMCVVSCVAPIEDSNSQPMYSKQVLAAITQEDDGIYCTPVNLFTPCDAGPGAPAKCLDTTDCPPGSTQAKELLLGLLSSVPKEELLSLLKDALKGS